MKKPTKHDVISTAIAAAVGKFLGLNNKEIAFVSFISNLHLFNNDKNE
jgi:hypothetical protein